MNAQRRKRIANLVERLSALADEIDDLGQEEQDYFDNMPESIQGSAKGDAASESADSMWRAKDNVTDAVEALEEATEGS